MTFNELKLHPRILTTLKQLGYKTPTPIQKEGIPLIQTEKDIICSAQTGTGKTAAFLLPVLSRMEENPAQRQTNVLILAPTRELAEQIKESAKNYGKLLQPRIVSLVGGMSYERQRRELKKGAHIIVATPGRLIDFIKQKAVSLTHVQTLILDEADRMLDMGFIDDVTWIANLTPKRKQTLLFSATIDANIKRIVNKLMDNPTHLDLSDQKVSAPRIQQTFLKVEDQHEKLKTLLHYFANVSLFKGIVFTATKRDSDKLAKTLRDKGYKAECLHGDMKQGQRNRTVLQFRQGKTQVLVATDVAARGIDIQDVSHVFNYDFPHFCEDYVHRIGRTGRAGREGEAISFIAMRDLKHVSRLERYLRVKFNVSKLNEDMQPVPVELSKPSSKSSKSRFRDHKKPDKKKPFTSKKLKRKSHPRASNDQRLEMRKRRT